MSRDTEKLACIFRFELGRSMAILNWQSIVKAGQKKMAIEELQKSIQGRRV